MNIAKCFFYRTPLVTASATFKNYRIEYINYQLIPRGISEKCVFLSSNNSVKKQSPELLCKKVNISQISRENTCEICEIFKNILFEEHMRTVASMGRLFRKVFQMQIS